MAMSEFVLVLSDINLIATYLAWRVVAAYFSRF